MSSPTIWDLLDDPVYAEYIQRVPDLTVTYGRTTRPHPAFTQPGAWQVWARTDEGKWKTGKFNDYERALNVVERYTTRDNVEDVALVSRRVFYPPPGEWYKVRIKSPTAPPRIEERWRRTFHWDSGLEWCARCRRPVSFRTLNATHHALRQQPVVTDDDPRRCPYCGIRQSAIPSTRSLIGVS